MRSFDGLEMRLLPNPSTGRETGVVGSWWSDLHGHSECSGVDSSRPQTRELEGTDSRLRPFLDGTDNTVKPRGLSPRDFTQDITITDSAEDTFHIC